MVITCESTNASPILVLSRELNVPGVVIMAYFGGILFTIFYRDQGSKYMTKPYRSTTVDFLMGWVYR